MRIFNFLLASDAVGGLGPPADLVNKPDATGLIIVFSIFAIIMVVGGLILVNYLEKKDKNTPKGDE